MRRSVPVTLVLLLLTSGSAMAQHGISMRWNACARSGGAGDRVFACNTNAGTETLVLSLASSALIENVSSCEVTIEVATTSGSMPSWWAFKNAGSCRQASLSLDGSFDPAWSDCEDTWSGQGIGGIAAYDVGFYGPNTARIRAVIAVPLSGLGTITPGTEYFILNLRVNHAKTVGTGNCSGCNTPACLFFSDAKVTTPIPANDVTFTTPAFHAASQWVTWQDGYPTNLAPFTCSPGSVPAPNQESP